MEKLMNTLNLLCNNQAEMNDHLRSVALSVKKKTVAQKYWKARTLMASLPLAKQNSPEEHKP